MKNRVHVRKVKLEKKKNTDRILGDYKIPDSLHASRSERQPFTVWLLPPIRKLI